MGHNTQGSQAKWSRSPRDSRVLGRAGEDGDHTHQGQARHWCPQCRDWVPGGEDCVLLPGDTPEQRASPRGGRERVGHPQHPG